MLGRQVGTSLLRLPRCTRLPVRSLPYQQLQHGLAIRTIAPSSARFYAQITPSRPGRPKKAVGEPSRPVKRAVKRAAKSPKEDAASKKVKARKETAQKKKRVAAKPTARKARALSEEEKAKQAERLAKHKERTAVRVQKANIAELKKIALSPPHLHQYSAHNLFMKDRMGGDQFKGVGPGGHNQAFGERQKEVNQEWRNVTPAELEHYNHLRHQSREKEAADHKQYVESHTVEEIEAANKARQKLRAHFKNKTSQAKKWPAIKDERAVKKPINAYAQFTTNRFASGDFKDIKMSEAAKLIGQEWRALSNDEKQKYNELYKQDRGRYTEEYTSVHGHAPAYVLEAQPAQAAAAAA